ncbi:ester cyclase [Kutzneria chonburiensis]|uniref:Ester cyclase n=1 Tax=Kutzneria chonburiensis TaxID=1483604 RepID=A0ABV6MLU6_9PSEU|nr:ester cyclase [Kutzneria chonburiensis]
MDEVQTLIRYFLTGEESLLAQVVADDHHDHVSGQVGPDIYRTVRGWLTASFGDLAIDLRAVGVDGELVLAWWVVRGRHTGNAFPQLAHGRVPEGRPVSWPAVHVFRLADGRFVEHWAVRDDLGLLRQLGAAGDQA